MLTKHEKINHVMNLIGLYRLTPEDSPKSSKVWQTAYEFLLENIEDDNIKRPK